MKAAVIQEHDGLDKLKAVTTAKLKPVIDSVAMLENIKDATGKMEAGEQFGKIVLWILK